ncbi:MAG: beta-N-acetylhexosaminidase [Marinifilaceae bacterium]
MNKTLFKATILLLCIVFSSSAVISAQEKSLQVSRKDLQMHGALVPMVNNISYGVGKGFAISNSTKINIDTDALMFVARELQNTIYHYFDVKPEIVTSSKSRIRLVLDTTITNPERYKLIVTDKGIEIIGATTNAVLHGVMTMSQLLAGDEKYRSINKIQPVCIDDEPRFPFRALMIDPARHFLPVNDVKFYIDQMRKYKFNVLQLHLTDDQGWRIEIKQYPELTANQPHYTQEELKDLIQYAAQRGIEIIPELDVPGHTVAILALYPQLGCTHTFDMEKNVSKTVDMMLCSNNPEVYAMYDNILAEVAELFPSKKIHLGGDEAIIEKNWSKCERCKALMKERGFTKPTQLMVPFFQQILSSVREHGKEPILWCELDNVRMPANNYLFPYPDDVTLVTWRMGLTPKCIELTEKSGHNLIMAPGEYAYLDYPQLKGDLPEFNNWGMPVTTLEKCYQFDPGYGLSVSQQKHIQGVMGTLWGEAMKDINRVTYMTFPRAMAVAEAGWTQTDNRSWESFKYRIYPNITELMQAGVFVRVPYEIIKR